MKILLKFVGSSVLSALLVFGGLVAHMKYESSQYVPPPTLEQQLDNVVAIQTIGGDYCSGWILKGTHTIVTAAHCVPADDATLPVAVLFQGDETVRIFHVEKRGDENLKQGPDLMTLTTDTQTQAAIKWPAGLSVCTFKPYYGEHLNLMGGPLAYSSTISGGQVSNPDRNLDDAVQSTFGHFIQYDGALMPGNSGGPAIDSSQGCVMGVAEMLYAREADGQIFNLAFLTPITYLDQLK
jgi:S1-C subfamily serine protease